MLSAEIGSLPPRSRINYPRLAGLTRAVSTYEVVADLRLRLPALWKKAYTAAASHTPNIIYVEYGTFDYTCDADTFGAVDFRYETAGVSRKKPQPGY